MSRSLAAILGGAAAGLALVVIVIAFLWLYMLHCKNISNRNSETASSDPTVTVEWNGGGRVSSASGCALTEKHGARQFSLEELEQATKKFSERNLVGHGSFGVVYKGLLSDGTIVAIKRRVGAPSKDLVEEVRYLSEIWHRNLVTLIGYCQESGLQMLVFDYVPNGSINSHLYDTGEDSTRLEFKQRLSVALGAAKGLCHLHGLVPPFVHKDFNTTNVLVDENFIAKVADAGITKLLARIGDANSSQAPIRNVFQDPEFEELGMFSEMSDVYSFGVFLLELVTGRHAEHLIFSRENESLTQWAEEHIGTGDFIDQRLGNTFTFEGMKDFLGLILRCMDLSGRRRPRMEAVVSELDRILEREMTLTTVMGDGTTTVTLGSQLFSSA